MRFFNTALKRKVKKSPTLLKALKNGRKVWTTQIDPDFTEKFVASILNASKDCFEMEDSDNEETLLSKNQLSC